MAAGLLELGLAPGDRLGIWSLNASEIYLTYFAAIRAGLITVSWSEALAAVWSSNTDRKVANGKTNNL
jgi:acyl-CoA synthetase (AMP-forming)/AMP-acid ligase II